MENNKGVTHQIIKGYGVQEKEKGEKVAKSACTRCAECIWTVIEIPPPPAGRAASTTTATAFITGFCDTLKAPVWDDDPDGKKIRRVVVECTGFVPLQPILASGNVEAEKVGGMPNFQ